LRSMKNYLIDFQTFCQNNMGGGYSARNTLPIEASYLLSLEIPIITSSANAALLFFCLLFELTILIFLLLRSEQPIEEDSKKPIGEEKVIEFEHNKVENKTVDKISDKTDRTDRTDNKIK